MAAYSCLLAIFVLSAWFAWYVNTPAATSAHIAAMTTGYVITLAIIAGCMVALLVGIYDLGRLGYLAKVHESTVSAVAKTDTDGGSDEGDSAYDV